MTCARRDAANRRDAEAWARVTSRAEWEAFRDARIEALRRSLGDFSVATEPPRAWTTGVLEGEGFRIENVVYESRPGVLVTANLYLPAPARERMPAILIIHSHHNPKTQGELQDMGMTWARQGCAVLFPDQFGHGERRQHPEGPRQDYRFRGITGIQLHVLGESLIGWMVWDVRRGLDLLLDREDVDPRRVILIGAVAGGGDLAAVAAALDPRIACAIPFNFGGPQPETTYPLPADAETTFDYMGSGSWESTRNLRLNGRDGFLPWVIVASVAPRRLIYAHEFSWDRERDPVWKRLQAVFALYNASDHLAYAHGAGLLAGRPPEATHCNNVGPPHRAMLYPHLERWCGIPIPRAEYSSRRPPEELHCLKPDRAPAIPPPRPLHELFAEIGAARAAAARETLSVLAPEARRERLREWWARLLGAVEPIGDPVACLRSREEIEGLRLERVVLQVEPGIVVPLLLMLPGGAGTEAARDVEGAPRSEGGRPLGFAEADRGIGEEGASRGGADRANQEESASGGGAGRKLGATGMRPVVVGVAQAGKDAFLRERAGEIAALLEQGIAVCLPDVRGTGETGPGGSRERQSPATSLSATEWMLGQTLLGSRLRDLRAVLRYLRSRRDVDAGRIALWGEAFALVNRPGFADPLLGEGEPPAHSEPLGGLLALFGALYEDGVRAAVARGVLAGYAAVLRDRFCYIPHDAIVPGALTAGDLGDVAAALAPRPLRLEAPVDGRNCLLTEEELRRRFAPAVEAYRPISGGLALFPLLTEGIAAWLGKSLVEAE